MEACLVKTLIMASDEEQFKTFQKYQAKPDDFTFARDEVTIMRQNNVNVIFLPGWIANPEYQKIRNLVGLLGKVRTKK